MQIDNGIMDLINDDVEEISMFLAGPYPNLFWNTAGHPSFCSYPTRP